MTDPARGPTTEELRARVLAHEARFKFGAGRGSDTEGAAARNSRPTTPEGRTFYDPARPPLDSEGAERPTNTDYERTL